MKNKSLSVTHFLFPNLEGSFNLNETKKTFSESYTYYLDDYS